MKKANYSVFVYKATPDGFNHRLISVFPSCSSLHDAIHHANISLTILYKLDAEGYCQVIRDGVHIGNVNYDSNLNTFVFVSCTDWFDFRQYNKHFKHFKHFKK